MWMSHQMHGSQWVNYHQIWYHLVLWARAGNNCCQLLLNCRWRCRCGSVAVCTDLLLTSAARVHCPSSLWFESYRSWRCLYETWRLCLVSWVLILSGTRKCSRAVKWMVAQPIYQELTWQGRQQSKSLPHRLNTLKSSRSQAWKPRAREWKALKATKRRIICSWPWTGSSLFQLYN